MMYQLYQAQADLLLPLRQFAKVGACLTRLTHCGSFTPSPMRQIEAALTMFAEAGLTHARPSFDLDQVMLDGQPVHVIEEAADDTPFGTLLHFRKDSDAV